MKKERVLTHGLRRDSRTLTGKAYIHVMKDAESSITILPGANKLLLPEDILSREHLFEGSGYRKNTLRFRRASEAAIMCCQKAKIL